MTRSILPLLYFLLGFVLVGSFSLSFAASPEENLKICQRSCSERGGMFFFSSLGEGSSTNNGKIGSRCVCFDDFEHKAGPGIAITHEKK